jgi:hypothetical protein
MTAADVIPPAPAPAPQQKNNVDLKICEEIRKRVSLTPSSIIDALCNNEPAPWICLKAMYVEEVTEIARMLGRSLTFRADC